MPCVRLFSILVQQLLVKASASEMSLVASFAFKHLCQLRHEFVRLGILATSAQVIVSEQLVQYSLLRGVELVWCCLSCACFEDVIIANGLRVVNVFQVVG